MGRFACTVLAFVVSGAVVLAWREPVAFQVIFWSRRVLLGPCDWSGYAEGYNLGNHSGFRIDPDVLHLDFDGAGRVNDIRVVQY